MAVILDSRPMRFAKENDGIVIFAEDIIEAAQTISYGASSNRKSYLPKKTDINLLLKERFTSSAFLFAII